MEYKTITYQRVKNLGNYQSERLEMSVELNACDDPDRSAVELMEKVEKLLNSRPVLECQPPPSPF